MLVDAITKLNKTTNGTRLDVFLPKYKYGAPIIALSAEYEKRPIKLITGWKDISDLTTPVTINGGIIPDNQVGVCHLARGMYVSTFGNDNVYVVVPERLI